jgi:hypothetical protein
MWQESGHERQRRRKKMRKTLLMLVVMSCMVGAQIASAQAHSVGDPEPATSTATSSDTNHATTTEAAPNVSADPAAANLVVKENTAKHAKAKKKDDTANMQPDDPRKNPWWEPRDWTYINNSAP